MQVTAPKMLSSSLFIFFYHRTLTLILPRSLRAIPEHQTRLTAPRLQGDSLDTGLLVSVTQTGPRPWTGRGVPAHPRARSLGSATCRGLGQTTACVEVSSSLLMKWNNDAPFTGPCRMQMRPSPRSLWQMQEACDSPEPLQLQQDFSHRLQIPSCESCEDHQADTVRV